MKRRPLIKFLKTKFKWDELLNPSATNAKAMVDLVGMFNL
jgi:hypothetical protein